MSKKPQIHDSWLNVLYGTFQQPFMQSLRSFLVEEMKSKTIYPRGNQIFAAFNHTPFERVRVVILGQDPYHGPGQAHGLSFSVPNGVYPPPSLQNIFQELVNDVGVPPPQTGNLSAWAAQGVLLLNTALTVRARQANSHRGKGWAGFTDQVIRVVNQERDHVVFILWGRNAQEKSTLVDQHKHLILQSSHPSPYSANYGFFGSRPFSRANQFLHSRNIGMINWRL